MNSIFFTPPKSTWKVKWGRQVFIAPTAFDILATIGEASYNPNDAKHPKQGIAYRVFVQYRVLVDDDLPDEVFLTRLAEYGIIELSVSGVRPPDVLAESLEFIQAWHGTADEYPLEKEEEA